MRPTASNRLCPTQQCLGFDYDEGHKEQSITALAGIPLLAQAFRSLGLPASVKRNVSSNSDLRWNRASRPSPCCQNSKPGIGFRLATFYS